MQILKTGHIMLAVTRLMSFMPLTFREVILRTSEGLAHFKCKATGDPFLQDIPGGGNLPRGEEPVEIKFNRREEQT